MMALYNVKTAFRMDIFISTSIFSETIEFENWSEFVASVMWGASQHHYTGSDDI